LNKPETEAIPHTAVIYPNRRYRNRSIESCIRKSKTSWGSLAVLSVQPDTDISFFKTSGRKSTALRAVPHASVIDVRDTLSRSKDRARGMISLLNKARQNRPAGHPALIIGDWIHQIYDDFGVALAFEESEGDEPNTVCCYREEGFWSLGCEQIARIFEMHRRVIFGSSVFEM
jgi:hypothetical protein